MTIDDVGSLDGLVAGQPLTEAEAEGWVPKTCFKHGPPGQVGIELEFLVHSAGPVPAHLSPQRLRTLIDELVEQPLNSAFSVEPGGQVELSSRPAPDLATVIGALEADLGTVAATLRRHGARLTGAGLDPLPPPERLLTGARYDAMENYFDRWGPAGRAMMRSTASVQVNVEAGRTGREPDDMRRRWDVLHAVGPVLAATFSTSPPNPAHGPVEGRDWSGYANSRQGIWLTLDPARCRPPRIGPAESLPDAYTRWVLDAPVSMVRRPEGPWTAPAGLTFREWIRAGGQVGGGGGGGVGTDLPRPDVSDLAYHLTTVFPPVRARGHLEVRYLDAQPGRWWRVPAATVAAIVDDDRAGDEALAVCDDASARAGSGREADADTGPADDDWRAAARTGLTDPARLSAARELLTIAAEALDRAGGATAALAETVAEYLDRRPAEPFFTDTAEVLPC